MVDFSKWSIFWKIILEQMTGKVVVSEEHTLAYVVLSEAEKDVTYGECITL